MGRSSSSSVGRAASLAGRHGESPAPSAKGTKRKGEASPALSLSPSPACAPCSLGPGSELGKILQDMSRK